MCKAQKFTIFQKNYDPLTSGRKNRQEFRVTLDYLEQNYAERLSRNLDIVNNHRIETYPSFTPSFDKTICQSWFLRDLNDPAQERR